MAASTDPLNEDIQKPVTTQARVAIVQHLWPYRGTLPSKRLHLAWDAYFEFYTRECTAVLRGRLPKQYVINHRDVLRIIHLLEETDEKEENRNALCEKLKRSKIARMMTTMRSSTGPSYIVRVRETLDDLTVLSTRILTMTPVGQATSSQKLHPTCILPWNTGSLQNAVHGYFNQPPDIPLEAKDDIIGVSLTFFNIERVSGIKVIPTDNLLDHLLLVDEDRKLCVFHHASFVKQMLATQRYVT